MADGMWLLDAHKLALRGRDFEDGAIALKRDGPMWLAGGQPTGTDRAILDLLSDGEVRPRLWLRERLLDIPIRTLDAHLKALQDAGKLQQPGHGRYRVISRG
jgi:DNA-binding transcriptional ArsR family regulator